jgi:hypothetical protein
MSYYPSLEQVGFFEGEEWVYFHWAADKIGDKLAITPGAAQARLRKLCASGEIRTMMSWDNEEPETISPSQWRDEDVDLIAPLDFLTVAVNRSDLRRWLDQQPTQAAGGKQSRVARLLAEMFPAGVPTRADCPREPLRAELIKRDPSLQPLDLKTLKTAIEMYNRQVGNARNASFSD